MDPFDLARLRFAQQQVGRGQPQQQPQQRGGIAGFLGGIARSAVRPFGYVGENVFVNPIKELAAEATGNKEALRNARRKTNESLGVINSQGEADLGNALKRLAGNTAQIGLTFVPGGGVAKSAAIGAGTGIGSAMTQEGATLEDVLASAAIGGGTGGALRWGGGKIANRFSSKAGTGVSDDIARLGTKAEGGARDRASRALLSDAWGITPGKKVSGAPLTPQRATALQRFTQETIGVPRTAGAETVFARASQFQDEAGSAISNAVSTANPLNRTQTSGLASRLQAQFNKTIGANARENPVATDILTGIRRAKTPQQLWELRRNIDDALINWNRAGAATTPGGEQIARAARSEINKTLKEVVPDFTSLNRVYKNASDVLDLTASASANPRGAQLPGFFGRAGGRTVQQMKGAAGQLLDRSGSASQGGGRLAQLAQRMPDGQAGTVVNAAGNVASRLGRQGLTSMAGDMAFPEAAPAQPGDLSGALGGLDQMGGMDQMMQQQSMSPYPRENLMADIQRDPANADKYIEYYQMLDEVFNPQGEQAKPLTGEAARRALMSESGLRSLDQLEQTLASDPGAFQRQALPNPFGITARLTGTTDVRAATDNLVDVIARLRSGAAITDSEAARFARLLPQPGDSSESARYKLSMVRQELESYLQQPQSGSTNQASLADVLSQYGAF